MKEKSYLEIAEELEDFLHWNENDEELRDLAFKEAKELKKEIEKNTPCKIESATGIISREYMKLSNKKREEYKKAIEKLNKIIGDKNE